jgi:4-alpha-glucanotransferase
VTSTASDIDRLADLVGIEPFFHDIWGNRYDVSRETKVALIAALGFAAGDAAEIAASRREVEEAPWRRLLPPVRVLGAQEPLVVPLTVADGDLEAVVAWTLTEENGAIHRGEARPAGLPVTAGAVVDGRALRRCVLALPVSLPLGYHRLVVGHAGQSAELSLILAPERCVLPEEVVSGGRSWGLGVQLYGLRSTGNWGMGDFSDLAELGERAAGWGAGTVGLNPLHALFPADPNHYSPYSPSHRVFLDVFYLDVIAVPDLAECPEARDLIGSPGFQRALAQARAAELVDYPAVAALKRPVLERLFASFQSGHLEPAGAEPPVVSARAAAFCAFQAEGGETLARFALFEALHEHFYGSDPLRWSWQSWPQAYRDPDSPEVAAFAATYADRVTFFQYLQWLADEQLGQAAARARAAGLAFGFYRDLAVAIQPGGAAAWAAQTVMAPTARVGAPPDQFNLHGQDWGLAPMSPRGLVEAAYRPFIAVLRANMRHAGVLRIDHVMALQHLYWIPPTGGIGAYVAYPFADLVRLVALESHRNRCVVIGEDLGTVPEGFRPAMQRAGILSCRVFYFERGHDGAFLPPEAYPEGALVTATTHDLATLKGFWQGVDLRWRIRLGLYPSREMQDGEVAARDHDRWRLLTALERAGLLPESLHPRHGLPRFDEDLMVAIYRALARSPSRLLMVQLEDVLLEAEQPNLPGTVDQHPNWRRRTALSLEQWSRGEIVTRLAAAIKAFGR